MDAMGLKKSSLLERLATNYDISKGPTSSLGEKQRTKVESSKDLFEKLR
jgi:hypothetical protein